MKCRRCGAGPFANLAAVRQHHRDAHGLTSGGNDRGSFTAGEPRPRVRERKPGSRRIEDVTGASDTTDPTEASSGAEGETSTPDPAPRSAPSRPTINAPTIHITSEARVQSVTDAVRDALPLDLLADLIHTLSVAVSEADGAGEAGYLSKIQSTQVAVLLYDSTVDLVVTRFKGDVSRFKAGLAVIVILASKGSVHGRAIRDRVRARQARAQHDAILEAVSDDAGLSPVELAMRRQGSVRMSNDEGIG